MDSYHFTASKIRNVEETRGSIVLKPNTILAAKGKSMTGPKTSGE